MMRKTMKIKMKGKMKGKGKGEGGRYAVRGVVSSKSQLN